MNQDEIIVKQHLESLGFTNIKYEPDGNVSPNFLIDNKISVEARRLNKHYNGEALEDLLYKLMHKIEKLFHKFKAVNNSAAVSIKYNRRLKITKKLINNVRKTLEEHLPYITEQKKYKICENFEIRFYPANKKKYEYSYMLSHIFDRDATGWVLPDTLTNLNKVIDEKSEKSKPYFYKYEEWRLALVNHIRPDPYDQDAEENIRNCFLPPYDNWNKILIISPMQPECALEFNNSST